MAGTFARQVRTSTDFVELRALQNSSNIFEVRAHAYSDRLNLSAPEILQRPAPQPWAPLFGAPRPERPSAPANPGPKKPRRIVSSYPV